MKEPTRDDSGLQASKGMEQQALQDMRRANAEMAAREAQHVHSCSHMTSALS